MISSLFLEALLYIVNVIFHKCELQISYYLCTIAIFAKIADVVWISIIFRKSFSKTFAAEYIFLFVISLSKKDWRCGINFYFDSDFLLKGHSYTCTVEHIFSFLSVKTFPMYSLTWYPEHLQYILKQSEFDFQAPTTTSIFFSVVKLLGCPEKNLHIKFEMFINTRATICSEPL